MGLQTLMAEPVAKKARTAGLDAASAAADTEDQPSTSRPGASSPVWALNGSACMYSLPDLLALTVEEATTAGVLRHHLLAHALRDAFEAGTKFDESEVCAPAVAYGISGGELTCRPAFHLYPSGGISEA